jgi:hypothetical protein
MEKRPVTTKLSLDIVKWKIYSSSLITFSAETLFLMLHAILLPITCSSVYEPSRWSINLNKQHRIRTTTHPYSK